MSGSFRILCFCPDHNLRVSMNDFITPLLGHIGSVKLVDSVADMFTEVVRKNCPYHCVLLPLSIPGAYAKTHDKQGFEPVVSLGPGESIALAALRANQGVRCILLPAVKGQKFVLDQMHPSLAKGRVYCGEHDMGWQTAFVASNLFPDIVDELDLATAPV